ncbi:MAG: hypothetical protein SGILL_008824, partial [Bacillariaceae sp.]
MTVRFSTTGTTRWLSLLCLSTVVAVILAAELKDEVLEELRIEGACAKNCHLDTDATMGNYYHLLRLQRETRGFSAAFEELIEDLTEESFYDDLQRNVAQYCETEFQPAANDKVTMEDCLRVESVLRDAKVSDKLIISCFEFMEAAQMTPSFEAQDPRTQEKETCLMDFEPERVLLEKSNSDDFTTEHITAVLQRYGVVIIQNFFSRDEMKNIHDILRNWRDTGMWKDTYNFTTYHGYKHLHGNGNRRKNAARGEIVLPFEEPFLSIVDQIDKSILIDVMHRYGNRTDLNMEYATSIFSEPPANHQGLHSDYNFPVNLFKIGIAVHDTPKVQGPTGFCPCTHAWGDFFPPFATDVPCPLRFQADFIPAGTVFLYDQAIQHQG